MNDRTLVSYLRLVLMPTDDEIALQQRRRAWWIASVRRADPRKPKLTAVAKAVGLAENSASTISDWENNIGGGPSVVQLHKLAAFYGVPVSMFMEPEPTEQEYLDQVRALALDAVELEQEDSASEETPSPTGDDARAAQRGRRSA